MSFLEILFWVGVVYLASVFFCLVGFAIITDGFSDTSKKFCPRVLAATLIICSVWPFVFFCILVLWAMGELSD